MKDTQKAPRDAEATTQAAAQVSASDPQRLHAEIALLAYRRAEDRNFEAGHELDDWLGAEAQILAQTQSLKGFPA